MAEPPPGAGRAGRVRLRLQPTGTAAMQARRALRRLGLPGQLAHDALLLTSELVTNSVRHAGLGSDDRIDVTADWSGTRLRVQVRDRSGRERPARSDSVRPTPGAESGWGLYLVNRLASRWGTTHDGYWFELRQGPAGRDG